jgi:hypothetical protein
MVSTLRQNDRLAVTSSAAVGSSRNSSSGLPGQGEHEPDPLGLPAGKLLHAPVCELADAGQRQQFGQAAAVGIELAEEVHKLAHRAAFRQPAGLQHAADLPGAHRGRRSPAEHPHLAGGGGTQAEHGVDGGGLARPVGAEQRHDLAPADVEGHAIECAHIRAVDLDYVAEGDRWRMGARLLCGHVLTLGAAGPPVMSRRSRSVDDRCHAWPAEISGLSAIAGPSQRDALKILALTKYSGFHS